MKRKNKKAAERTIKTRRKTTKPSLCNADLGRLNAEEMYKKLTMTSSDAVILSDLSGVILYASERAAHLIGAKNTEELCGMTYSAFFGDVEREKAEENMRRISKEGFVNDIEYTVKKKNGTNMTIRVNAALINDHRKKPVMIIATARDISEKKKLMNDVREAETNYSSLFNAVNDPIVVLDSSTFDILDANDAFFRARRIDREKVRGLNVKHFGGSEPGFTGQDAVRHAREAADKGIKVIEWKETKQDGSTVWSEIKLQKARLGKTDRLLGIVRDITAKKKSEYDMRRNYAVLKKIMDGIIRAMEKLVEKKDKYTVGHQRRTADLAKAIAEQMGLAPEQAECVFIAGVIHDIGKIFISGEILNKPGSLTGQEYDIIKGHPQAGYEVLHAIDFPWPVDEIILQHHERMDGSGYPKGLKGDGIYLESRIIAVADVVEAMTFDRPYRQGFGIEMALQEITNNRGRLYDPEIVDICVSLFRGNEFTFRDIQG